MPGQSNKKGSQRTKGNLKPSSSSQAAELLAASGGGVFTSGFIGFGASPGAAAFVPVSEALEDEDTGLDPAFRVTLRKLSKRDSVTKLKALQEFSALCKDSDVEAVKATLPFWPKMYTKVAVDTDHKVREASQQAMAALVSRVRRSLAPHLKTVMGCWLLCQCDTYPTVATAAQQAFSTAFPPAKQTDAIVFCKDEIAEFLSENLTAQTAHTLSNPKTTSAEDMEIKYNRMMTSSLLAWRKLLETLPPSTQGSFLNTLTRLLEDPKLWKFSKSPVVSIKSALYTFLSGVCQFQSEVAVKFSSKIAPLAFHNIDETDSILCTSLWETALSAATFLPDCWNHVNAQKAFLPKLRKLLANGCHGNAAVVGPNILPLLSKIPDDIYGSKDKVVQDIFLNLKQGLCLDQVRNSPSGCGALVRAFMECAQYSVKQALNVTETGDTAKSVLLDQVLPLIEASFVDEHPSLSRSPLYEMVGVLMRGINQSEEGSHCAVVSFRQELQMLLLDYVRKLSGPETSDSLSKRLSACVRALINPNLVVNQDMKLQNAKSVKFLSEKDSSKDGDLSSEVLSPVRELDSGIHTIVTGVCLTAFQLFQKEDCEAYLGIVRDILTIYPDTKILQTVLERSEFTDETSTLHGENIDTVTVIPVSFMFTLCLPLLRDAQTKEDSVSVGHLVDIVLTLSAEVTKTEAMKVLSSVEKTLTTLKHFQILVDKCLTWRKRVPGIREWFRDEEFGERIVELTRNACQNSLVAMETEDEDVEHQWMLITSVFSPFEGEEPMLSPAVTASILGQIEQTLKTLEKKAARNRLETAICFVSDVMLKFFCSLKGCLLVPAAEKLLLTLFSLSMEDGLNVTEACSDKLEQCWRCSVEAMVRQGDGSESHRGFLTSFCEAVSDKTFNKVHSLSSLDRVYKSVQVLLRTVQDNLSFAGVSEQTVFLNKTLFDDLTHVTIETTVPSEILQFLAVTQNFTSADFSLTYPAEMTVESLSRVIYPAILSARLLLFSKTEDFQSTLTKPVPVKESESENIQDKGLKWEWSQKDITKLQNLCYQLTLSQTWCKVITPESCQCTADLSELESVIKRLLSHMAIPCRRLLLALSLDRSDGEGWVWSQSLGKLLSLISEIYSDTEFSSPGLLDRYSTLTLSKVHTLQVISSYLSVEEQVQLTEVMVAKLISLPVEDLGDINGAVGPLAVVRSLLPNILGDESSSELLKALLEQLLSWRQEAGVSLTGNFSSTESSAALTFNLEVMRFLGGIVQSTPEVLTDNTWDYVLCAMIGWLQNLQESEDSLMKIDSAVQQLCVASCHLVGAVADCIQNASIKGTQLPANLSTEWEEFFSEGSYSILIPLFLRMTGWPMYKGRSGVKSVVVGSVSHAVSLCPKQQILSHQLPAYLIADQDSTLPNSVQTLFNHFCPILMFRNRSEQIAAFCVLDRVIGEVPVLDQMEEPVVKANADKEETSRSPPDSLMKVLNDGAGAMDVILQDLTVDENVTIIPLSEEYSYILGYLLSWKLLLNFFKHVPNEVRPEYAAYLKESGAVYTLITDLFRLMPDPPNLPSSKRSGGNVRGNMFEVMPKLSPLVDSCDRELQHLACSVYRHVLEIMPAMARQWWKDQDRKTSAYVDKFSTKYVSPLLCTSQIQTVQSTDVKLDNITVKALAASREVIATYALEEVKTEMVIALPQNYPLGNISVTSEKRVGVSASQWEKWLLQLNIFLQHQNGSIVDGLQMWKRNIDKRFEGVEECTICYSVIHGTTLQLPRLQCRTCKKKFHSACLYKWFNTSHNSTCPLCRNLF